MKLDISDLGRHIQSCTEMICIYNNNDNNNNNNNNKSQCC